MDINVTAATLIFDEGEIVGIKAMQMKRAIFQQLEYKQSVAFWPEVRTILGVVMWAERSGDMIYPRVLYSEGNRIKQTSSVDFEAGRRAEITGDEIPEGISADEIRVLQALRGGRADAIRREGQEVIDALPQIILT
jgi:hypothetical protein